jgi:hypothetical protein
LFCPALILSSPLAIRWGKENTYSILKMKKLLVVATAMVAGLAVGIAQAEDEKGKGKGKGKGGDPAKRAEMMIKKLDKDGNGTLSKEEFAASPMAKKAQEAGKGDAVDKMFAGRDKNSDGQLDKAEISAPRKGGKGKPKPKPDGDKKKKAE